MKTKSTNKGFTLIEIITAIAIMGIIGVFGSVFLVNMFQSYQLAEENTHLSQKAQVAFTRIAVEMAYADSVDVDNNEIIINLPDIPDSSFYRDNDKLYLKVGSGTPRTLSDQIKNDSAGFTVVNENSEYLTITLIMTGSESEQEFTKKIVMPQ